MTITYIRLGFVISVLYNPYPENGLTDSWDGSFQINEFNQDSPSQACPDASLSDDSGVCQFDN